VHGGKLEPIDGQDWLYPSSAQCSVCHTAAAGFSLGPEVLELNNELRYPTSGRMANQLATLDGIGVLANSPGDPVALASLVDPADATESLSARARSYLHTNCAQCHRPNGPTATDLDFRYRTALGLTGACNQLPQHGDLGLGPSARLIAPGNAASSVLVERMSRRDANGMPPLASLLVDADGVTLLTQWINSLGSCL
jgi:mono/diheme cytochrome c family protein